MDEGFDLIIIGAGPGGYVAAIKAAQLGIKTAIIEADAVGGTCLNRGCIPAKAMIHASALYQEMKNSERFGILAAEVSYDYDKILAYKEDTTNQLCQGIEQLLKANKVTVISGRAVVGTDQKVRVTTAAAATETVLSAPHILLAAGSRPVIPPIDGIELAGVLTSDELFALKKVPESLLIIGGGVISVEFASVFQALGCQVTIVEAMPRLIPNMDKELSQSLKMLLKKRGIAIHTAASVKRISNASEGLNCVFTEKHQEVTITASYVLCAVGRCPNIEGLFDADAAPQMERGRLVVDDKFATSRPGIYAIGDLIAGPQLAHAASAQGIWVAEMLAGQKPRVDLSVVPGCVYTNPEIASVGITEEAAKEQGLAVCTGKFIMSANGKSVITKEERGFIKIIASAETGVILGAQMMCARATDMIGELATAIVNELTAAALLGSMRAHPTFNEAVGEALEEVIGKAVHVMPRKG